MSDPLIKVYKFFNLHQDEECEQWLREMAQRGMHFQRTNWLSYQFRAGEPADISYRLVSTGKLREVPHWEYVCGAWGLHCWRQEGGTPKSPHMFNEIKIKVLQRVMAVTAILAVLEVMSVLESFDEVEQAGDFDLLWVLYIIASAVPLAILTYLLVCGLRRLTRF